MKNIAVTGASGFIGRNLVSKLLDNQENTIIALGRSVQTSSHENLIWRQVDLFSLGSTTEALKGVHTAYYLVHSMLPSTKLFQGSYYDTDLMLIDNFMRACKENGVKKVIFLGGLVPESDLSQHLKSRLEVEEVIKTFEIDFQIFRAGMIIGNGGSSFEILKSLTINLPFMVLPKWTSRPTKIIYLDDVINVLSIAAEDKFKRNSTFNLVTDENISYQELIVKTSKHVKKRTPFLKVPINYTSFSKLWVSIFGESNYELVSPLVESLLCDFSKISSEPELTPYIKYKNYNNMLSNIKIEKFSHNKKKRPSEYNTNTVRSIQRIGKDNNISAENMALLYLSWLPRHMRHLVKIETIHNENTEDIQFYLYGVSKPLLCLNFINNHNLTRIKFHIVGGLLCKDKKSGWLEFRNIGEGKYLLASINEFVPALPWYIYKYTQALIHLRVMRKFTSFLKHPHNFEI